MLQELQEINNFLGCETPNLWLEQAKTTENLPYLLIDHCNCELKAAQHAIYLMRKYVLAEKSVELLMRWAEPYEVFVYHQAQTITEFLSLTKNKSSLKIEKSDSWSNWQTLLVSQMLRLAKEEFHHFEQVLVIMQQRNIRYKNLPAGSYAKYLFQFVRTYEPAHLIDRLIIGAFIEARSCERFSALAPLLDLDLQEFYLSLLRSEARHYQDYLTLATMVAEDDISERINFWREKEAQIIQQQDTNFRFHSGIPVCN